MSSDVKHIPIDDDSICALMEEVFSRGGVFTFAPTGRSMLPMLRDGCDTVSLRSAHGAELKKYDVVLFRRDDGHIVLHRIIGRDRRGDFILCGDGQVIPEKGIRAEQIIGVLCGFVRNGKRISASDRRYRLYSALWSSLRPLRRILRGIRNRLGKVIRRVG